MLLTALLALADGTTVQACPTLAELKLGTRTPHRYFVRCLDVGGTASHAPFPGGPQSADPHGRLSETILGR